MPYLGLTSPAGHATGVGDLEFGPRFVFVERERFFLSANVLMTYPTGNAARDLGTGEMTIAPFLATWHGLGSRRVLPWKNWNTAYLNFGPQSPRGACGAEAPRRGAL